MAILEMMMPAYAATGPTLPTFLNIGTLGSSGNAITMGQPASPQANDVWIMVVQTANESITTPTNATAGTWAEIATQTGTGTAATAGSVRLGFFWHRWTTATGNVTVADSGNHQLARIAAYRGCKTSGNPWDVVTVMSSATWTSGTIWQPAITTTVDNTKMIMVMAHSEDIADAQRCFANAASPLSGNNERFDNTLATGTGGGIWLQDADMVTAGSINGTSQGMSSQLTTNPTNYIKCAVALTSQ